MMTESFVCDNLNRAEFFLMMDGPQRQISLHISKGLFCMHCLCIELPNMRRIMTNKIASLQITSPMTKNRSGESS